MLELSEQFQSCPGDSCSSRYRPHSVVSLWSIWQFLEYWILAFLLQFNLIVMCFGLLIHTTISLYATREAFLSWNGSMSILGIKYILNIRSHFKILWNSNWIITYKVLSVHDLLSFTFIDIAILVCNVVLNLYILKFYSFRQIGCWKVENVMDFKNQEGVIFCNGIIIPN